jgi:polyferredoxin
LRYLKFVILLVFVILLPLFAVDIVGQGAPYFCKYICPSGTILGGWPLVAMNEPLQATIGLLFAWKNLLLAIVVILSCVLYRPFCKYLCPLGAVYALFNRFSLYKLQIDRQKCTRCGACARVCKMDVDPCATPNHPECIRCGDCKKACPHGAVCAGIARRTEQTCAKESS